MCRLCHLNLSNILFVCAYVHVFMLGKYLLGWREKTLRKKQNEFVTVRTESFHSKGNVSNVWNNLSPLGDICLIVLSLRKPEDLALPSGLGIRKWYGAHKIAVLLNASALPVSFCMASNCLTVSNVYIICMAVLFSWYCLCFNYKPPSVTNTIWMAIYIS